MSTEWLSVTAAYWGVNGDRRRGAQVEVTTTKKTAERRKDLALITIKTIIESRPFVVRAVIDAKTEKRLDVDEAVKTKILDQKRRIYVNSITKEELTLADALDSGLLEVEFEKELNNGNGSVTRSLSDLYSFYR